MQKSPPNAPAGSLRLLWPVCGCWPAPRLYRFLANYLANYLANMPVPDFKFERNEAYLIA